MTLLQICNSIRSHRQMTKHITTASIARRKDVYTRGSGRWLTLRGRDRTTIFNQTSTDTISRTTMKKLLKDGVERVLAFPSAQMPS